MNFALRFTTSPLHHSPRYPHIPRGSDRKPPSRIREKTERIERFPSAAEEFSFSI
jgi:hypothetical protein